MVVSYFAALVLILFGGSARSSIQQAPPTLQVRKALLNQDVVQMVKAHLADSTIIKLIRANEADFDLSVAAVLQLKNSGVSQAVIEAMIATADRRRAPAPEQTEVAHVVLPPPAKALAVC
jgi:hypothetical protein